MSEIEDAIMFHNCFDNVLEYCSEWDTIIPIDHGFDESKPESELTLEDMQKAAEFRETDC